MTNMQPNLKRLRHERESRGIYQKEMATHLGISVSHYSDIEQGRRRLSYQAALLIASKLGVKPDDILLPDNFLLAR